MCGSPSFCVGTEVRESLPYRMKSSSRYFGSGQI